MKLITWNVNGIRAAWSHGLSSFLDTCKADIYSFQETRTDEPFEWVELEGYHAYWAFCTTKRGYSGTLCLTRRKPLDVRYGMGEPDFDTEGRIITLEFEEFFLVNYYAVHSQGSEERRDYRNLWDERLIGYLGRLRRRKAVIVCGDFNVTLSETDTYADNPRVEPDSQDFMSTERESILELVGSGYVDAYRHVHPAEQGKYSWWSNRLHKRKENRGWRLDYFFVDEALKDRITECTMLTEVYGSDHCPVMLEIGIRWGGEAAPPSAAPRSAPYTYQELVQLEQDNRLARYVRREDMKKLWLSVDWEQAENNLRHMQEVLARAAYKHDEEKITKWQKRIVCSLDAKLLAVRHTCDTAGGTGVDCVRWSTPHEKMSAALSLTSKGYVAMPSRLLLIQSKNGKQRRIHVETYHDRAMQCLYAYALDPVAESLGDRKSFAYRKGRSVFDMNEYIKQGLSGADAPTWVFIADVRRCYENISHEWIMEHIPMSKNVLYHFLKAGYVFGGQLFPTDEGVGIGCSISPIVANMTLDGLQDYVYSKLYPEGTDIDYADGNMVRYADDLLFMARTEATAYRISCYVSEFLQERGLALALDKCLVANVKDEFTFMSRTYYKLGTRTLARPSEHSMERFMSSVRDMIEDYTGSQKSLIEKLNRKIDGWATYHKTDDAEYAFRQMDVYINALLLKLCEEKHPKWTREKILERYWFVDGKNRHCYALPDKKEVRVKFLADTLLTDYEAVKVKLNPYIEAECLEARRRERQVANVTGIYRSIWERQEGKCHYCGHPILRGEEKELVEIEPERRRFDQRMAYVHRHCLLTSLDYVDAPTAPSSLADVKELLQSLDRERIPVDRKHHALYEYFRTCGKETVTLSFREIEKIMGGRLGASASHYEFWYRTGFGCISQCWLSNGYAVESLRMDRWEVTFGLAEQGKRTVSVSIPRSLGYDRMPADAQHEIKNYFRYILKKYGL